ncbi:hypothetical protein DXG01_002211 [Tephrocybe rancida]|nr:hypothetical protein DXG01_002211 [Tephrocybe rancida]
MASKSAPPPLAERSDIHKSCKSLEALLSIFNDYCEAAGAIVILQKKLAKALRDTAGVKTTGEIAANALNASATIFEVSSDIDSKFAKISDKEYDLISAEVKKWFKKLAKEEKIHDERMANANARIKQAGTYPMCTLLTVEAHQPQGQVYEKKSKKNPRDTTEEHARYINLISSLGPEISQEKYNHSLDVTRRHATTTYSAAACLSRVADAEWLKTCEGVRRYAPTIGQLGEWRALCEGGWSGSIPPDLIDPDESQRIQDQNNAPNKSTEKNPEDEERRLPTTVGNIQAKDSRESTENARASNTTQLSGSDHEPSREQLVIEHSPVHDRNHHQNSPVTPHPAHEHDVSKPTNSLAPSSYDPSHSKETNMDSVRSLSAFPLPPTHFPIPPRRQQASQSQSSQSSTSYPSMPRLTESPLPGDADQSGAPSVSDNNFPAQMPPPSHVQQRQDDPHSLEAVTSYSAAPDHNHVRQPIPVKSLTYVPPVINYDHRDEEPTAPAAEDNTDREFGVNVGYVPRSRAANVVNSPALERTDTGGSSGSIVAAMRNRYSENASITHNTTSPPPKVARRLSGNINDLANRYQPTNTPSSPRLRTPSAPRQLPFPPTRTGDDNYPQSSSTSGNINPPTPSSPRQEDAARRREQRLNDLAQLELKEKELALRERERDLQQKSRELDRERARLNSTRESDEYGTVNDLPRGAASPQTYTQIKPRERKISSRKRRPQSQLDAGVTPIPGPSQNTARPHSQYSYSTTNLIPPSPSSNSVQHSYSHDGQSQSPSSYTSHSHSPTPSNQFSQSPSTPAHAPYCGCESCSAAKYRAPRSPPDSGSLRPPTEPITLRPAEKKGGWMRRLSMPMGNALGLDSKKSITQNFAGVGSGLGSRGGVFSLDGKRNASSTQLNVREDGRRSYDASGISNRSMSNLLEAGRR